MVDRVSNSHSRQRARNELKLLNLLKQGAMTNPELSAQMGIKKRTIEAMIKDLKDADVIRSVPKSHKIALGV